MYGLTIVWVYSHLALSWHWYYHVMINRVMVKCDSNFTNRWNLDDMHQKLASTNDDTFLSNTLTYFYIGIFPCNLYLMMIMEASVNTKYMIRHHFADVIFNFNLHLRIRTNSMRFIQPRKCSQSSQTAIMITEWIIIYIYLKIWDLIIHTGININLTKTSV